MVTEKDVMHVGKLADVGIDESELKEFSDQFTRILDYFAVLEELPEERTHAGDLHTILREDSITPSLPSEDALRNAGETEEGYIKAPRVM
ncbi:MAG: Asp-tRNA(Asn)/Glu-tRNA(Gln) amidotransferase subunit GatC [Methanospirillaceae archaeon]|nr:Asp-tRNA(Asn)/Glu-tRNA(Gln) amidotransferase subunit GatC [Methanospirillaceae archaeon]